MFESTTLLGPTSTSELDTLKCPRRYMYRYERKLVPKTFGVPLATGIVAHKCMAEGYKALRDGSNRWLSAALAESRVPQIDRDGLPIIMEEEQLDAMRDMLTYYWEHVGRYDQFDEILIVDEERFFEFAGWKIRITIDLAAKMQGRLVLFDHKTSGDISGDMAFLPLDLQTHLYYYGAWKILERPGEFVHNYIRRFDFTSDTRTGPPGWARADGTKPYLLTKSGKIATRSDEVNEYLRRERTPLTENQLRAYEPELTSQLQTLRFFQLSDNWPRYGRKLMECPGCSYYAICTAENNGHTVNPTAMDMTFVTLK